MRPLSEAWLRRLAAGVLDGYRRGIFPMADDLGVTRFYTADPRAIVPLDSFRCPRRLARRVRRQEFEVRVDTAFVRVLRGCAGRESTWISLEILRLYRELHRQGHAHSVEAWREGSLVGGLYGVSLGGAFFGESMFHLETDASKVCVVHLVERLRSRGYLLLDIQQQTPHMEAFGAILVPAREYLERLEVALAKECRFA